MIVNRRKQTATLFAVILLGYLLTTLLSTFSARTALREGLTRSELPLTGELLASTVRKRLGEAVLMARMMAGSTFLHDWVAQGEQERDRIEHYLRTLLQSEGVFTSFFISERSSTYYHPNGLERTVSPDNPENIWYYRLKESGRSHEVIVSIDEMNDNALTLFVNHAVVNGAGEFLGVAGVGLTLTAFQEMIRHHEERYGRHILFADTTGRIVLSGNGRTQPEDLEAIPALRPLLPKILAEPAFDAIVPDADSPAIYSVVKLAQIGWTVVIEQDRRSGQEQVRNTFWITLLIGLVITLLITWLAHLTIRRYQNRLEEMATIDPLTKALNRSGFRMVYERQRTASVRSGSPLTVILFDIDHFKSINDTYGHHVGDHVLSSTAWAALSRLRGSDTLCRWGGEEFLLLLPGCTLEDGIAYAEMLRRTVAEQKHGAEGAGQFHVTISAGVARMEPEEGPDDPIKRADAALYQAKRAGRDRIVPAP
ncbi:MAG: GGDEF domain-containing protein [Magnetococcales bacterium]|nr:GGDEF domain-containing protein [Magnetococcales bacterium]